MLEGDANGQKTYCLLKRGGSLLAALVLLLTMAGCAQGERSGPEGESTSPSPVSNTMTGEELMKELRIGWKLGNTFDAPDGETSWGNPLTTKELLEKVKELGFGTIRIPISWGKHVSEAPEYTIDADFLNRVETVVQDALDAGLYVIINSHHDNEIYMPPPRQPGAGHGISAGHLDPGGPAVPGCGLPADLPDHE